MGKRLIFENTREQEIIKFVNENKKRFIFNFLNQHDLYHFKNNTMFEKSLFVGNQMNFIDGFIISKYLSLSNLKRVSRTRGPTITREVLSNTENSKLKKHFFIGLEKKDLKNLQKKFPHLKQVSSYNPPYIKENKFSDSEIEKISELINKFNSDFVWVGIASPKQNILSASLFPKTNAQYFFNIGAATDFLLEKKSEAPVLIRKLGIEWLYRLLTDFKHTKKKVWRSFLSLKYLGSVGLKPKIE